MTMNKFDCAIIQKQSLKNVKLRSGVSKTVVNQYIPSKLTKSVDKFTSQGKVNTHFPLMQKFINSLITKVK